MFFPMYYLLRKIIALFFFTGMCTISFSQFMVGTGRKNITPQQAPIWLGGYASRDKPASGIYNDLWAKSLVIKDRKNNTVIIITIDAHKLSREISESAANRIMKKYDLNRSQIMFNVSHTHAGPMIWPNADMLEFKPADQQAVFIYSQKLTDDLVDVTDLAMNNLKPGLLSSGHGLAFFAGNRRNSKLSYRPVDNDVPVLKIESPDGKLMAVLFGYACHNTTLPGDYFEVNGDYAGFAQSELEWIYPGVTAMFFQGCAGDIDPVARGTLEDVKQNGRLLSDAVQAVLKSKLSGITAPFRTAYKIIELDFKPFNLNQFQKEIMSKDKYVQRRAKYMLLAYNNDFDLSTFSYPLQAIRFNNDLTILALGGEAVVDYSIITKKNYPSENLFMAGYCNEVICYIPTRRILDEGGYEPETSMIYYILPGPFDKNIEEKVLNGIEYVMKEVGAKPLKNSPLPSNK